MKSSLPVQLRRKLSVCSSCNVSRYTLSRTTVSEAVRICLFPWTFIMAKKIFLPKNRGLRWQRCNLVSQPNANTTFDEKLFLHSTPQTLWEKCSGARGWGALALTGSTHQTFIQIVLFLYEHWREISVYELLIGYFRVYFEDSNIKQIRTFFNWNGQKEVLIQALISFRSVIVFLQAASSLWYTGMMQICFQHPLLRESKIR